MKKDGFWAKGSFAQTMSSKDYNEKMKTFHKKHDEDMNFDCKKCKKKISAHNKDWHDEMCDDCFNEQYFPEEAQIIETDINAIIRHCKSKPIEKENMKFSEFLKSDEFDQEIFIKIVDEITKQIDCTKCANCCKVLGIVLNELDIERISKHLKLTKEEFISKYLVKNDNELKIKQLPCPFLKDNNCSIYEIRPKTCREYPNLDKDVSDRCQQFFSNAEICPIVFNVLENAKEEFLEEIYAFENPNI